MSTGKYLLGTAAIVGGVYYYDQFVQPILPRKQHEQLLQHTNHIDKDAQKYNAKLTDKIEQGKKTLQEKKESISDSFKDSKLYKNFQSDKEEYKYFAKDNVKSDDEKSVFKRGMQKYIDFINCLGEGKFETERTPYSSVGELDEVKEKPIFGGLFSKKDDVKDKAEAKKNEWSSWGSKKADQVKDDAEAKKNEWSSWGSKKADQVQADAEAKKNEWSSWGSKKADQVQADAEAKKNEWSSWGSKKLDQTQADAEAKKNELYNWSSEKADQAEAKKNELANWSSKKLDDASNELEKQKQDWSKWGAEKTEQAKEEAEKSKKSWLNWGSKKADEAEVKKNELSNWTANKVDEASNNLNKQYETTKKEAESSWNSTKDAINNRYFVEKDRAIKTYEEAKDKFEELSRQLRNDPNRNEKLQRAKHDAHSSLENLRLYGDDVYNDFKSKVKDLF